MGSTLKLFEFILDKYGILRESTAKEGKMHHSRYFLHVYLQHITSRGSPMGNLELKGRKSWTWFCRENENGDLCSLENLI